MESESLDPGYRVRSLSLTHFRNYDSLEIELSAGINLVVGENAQGKTNLLEALYLLSSTRLLRGQRDSEAIQEGFDKAAVTAEIIPSLTTASVVLERSVRKRVLLNGVGLPRASDILGRIPSVCISSADLPLVSGDPSDRRLFMDLELSQLYPAYFRDLAAYKRALEQRNALLKAAQSEVVTAEHFESWEAQLAKHGAELRSQRMLFLSNLEPYAQLAQSSMGAGESISLRYLAKDAGLTAEDMLATLSSNRRQEILRGTTLDGPHRDDISIEVAGRDARLYGSQGQQRTAMLSIKLGTMELEKVERGVAPLLLMDDILSDLDEGRRQRLMEWVLEYAEQTLLTCTEPAAAGEAIVSRAEVFRVRAGALAN